jgi:hypothetical protein
MRYIEQLGPILTNKHMLLGYKLSKIAQITPDSQNDFYLEGVHLKTVLPWFFK